MNGEGSLVNQMIEESDISGYLLKNIGQTEFLKALDKIAAGGIYFSDEVLQEMLKASERKKENEESKSGSKTSAEKKTHRKYYK